MKKIITILLATFCVTIISCNQKQIEKAIKQTPVDTLTTGNETAEEFYNLNRQSINVFELCPVDSTNFVLASLSDIYPLSENPDSAAIPNIKEKGLKAARYFKLESKYRQRFLSKTGVSETDSVFVYDYAHNHCASFLVKNLHVAAMINIYASDNDFPFSQHDYMIGFEIDKQKLKGFGDYGILVAVGKENPFAQEQLTPIVWKKIAAKDFPSQKINDEDLQYFKNLTLDNTHLFVKDSLQYFLQDYLSSDKRISARRLLVINSKTKETIIEKIFLDHESASPAPLNYENEDIGINQWTGKLFKNKPSVVFGFEYVSFGCPAISIIDKSGEDIYINCDNRH